MARIGRLLLVSLISLEISSIVSLLAARASAAPEETPSPPNIVLIIADDHGWGDFGFMGHPTIETPHLDRIASQGLLFESGYVPSSHCRPSLASLITGLYPHQLGIFSNDPPRTGAAGEPSASEGQSLRRSQRQLMIDHIDRVPTLPALLKEKGYLSFQSGKWWEGSFQRGRFTHGLTRGGRHGDAGLVIGRTTMQPIFDFIEQSEGRPFFVWYAPMLPHLPHNPRQELIDKYAEKTTSIELARYWATIEWFDATCGQLLAYLDEKGLVDKTLVIFTADNGWTQSLDRMQRAPRSKGSPYDAGIRTPIMLHWPGHIAPRRDETRVTTMDLAPTILAAAGLEKQRKMPGVNLLDPAQVSNRKTIFGEIYKHNAVDIHDPVSSLEYRWAISDRWKLIVPHDRERRSTELFDLVADPGELEDLVAAHPAEVKELSERLDSWWRPTKPAKPKSLIQH